MTEPPWLRARRVLVIAPHPDDETLGCGGLLARLLAGDAQAHVIFVTDGGASHPSSRKWPRARLRRQREREANAALDVLGARGQPRSFLRLRDADMPAPGSGQWTGALARLQEIIGVFQPDLALLPWRRDPHRDHRDSWRLARAAIAAAGGPLPSLEYAIWLDELGQPEDFPQPGEAMMVTVDVSPWRDVKLAALREHISQISGLIDDDPHGFQLGRQTVERLCGDKETYWRPNDEH